MIYQYAILTGCLIFSFNPKQNWQLTEWALLNVFFWLPLFFFIRFWQKINYIYGMEWFMNKYISPRSLVKN